MRLRQVGRDESDRGKAEKGCKNDMLHLPLETTEIKWIQSRESEAHRSQKARNQEPDKTCGTKCDYWDFACQQSFKRDRIEATASTAPSASGLSKA